MNASQTVGSVPVGVSSSIGTILVKFFFTNPAHIPSDIPEKDRQSNFLVDQKHVKNAYQNGHGYLATQGRIRTGRVDTGTHVIDNLQMVQVATVRKGLTNIGYRLAGAHWHCQPGDPAKRTSDKFVVVLSFKNDGDPSEDLSVKCQTGLRTLANTTWQWCHVWSNPDGTVTVNCGGRQQGQTPKHAVVIRNRTLTAIEVQSQLAEEEE